MSDLHEPFYDYEQITQEMADDMAKANREYKIACERLDETPNPVNTALVLETFREVADIYESINAYIYTIPVLVHIAGERREEANPDDPTQFAHFQRCARCGTVLHFWYEGMGGIVGDDAPKIIELEDIPWWEPGEVVAKHQHGISVGMYEVEGGRPLEKHERECVSLSGLEDITKGSN